jgi:autotransporter-associated beta strand protein
MKAHTTTRSDRRRSLRNWLHEHCRKSPARSSRRRTLELLEPRALLSAAAIPESGVGHSLAAQVAPAWFAPGSVNASQGKAVENKAPATEQLLWHGQSVEAAAGQWIVRLTPEATARAGSVQGVAELLHSRQIGAQVVRGLGLEGMVLVQAATGTDTEAVETWLTSRSEVAYFEPNAVLRLAAMPNDPDIGQLWGMHNTGQNGGVTDADIDAPEAWDIATGSNEVVVGVIDTGVDYNHPDLTANMWTNPDEIPGNGVDDDGNGFVDDVHGYDFVNNDGDPMDDHGHGTHVAGTIAAAGDNRQGIAGVNWHSSILAMKFIDSSGRGLTANAVRAVNYATMMRNNYGVNIRVTNNSWGGPGYDQSLHDAIKASGDAGMLFVAAAGNSGLDNDAWPNYPSSYDLNNIIAVAATDCYDGLASFSNYGAESVDLAAPGVNILSTVPRGGYAFASGTSMAAPHVAGVVALACSVAPTKTAAEIRQAVLESVDPLPSLGGKVATGGRLNALKTLQEVLPPAPRVVSITRVDTSPTNASAVRFTVNFSEPVTGVDAGDFVLTTTRDTCEAAVAAVEPTGGFHAAYTVTVNTGKGLGTLRLDVSDDDTIVTAAAGRLGGPGPGNGDFTDGQAYAKSTCFATTDLDDNGKQDLVIDFGDPWGTWTWMNDSAWVKLHDASPEFMLAANLDQDPRGDLIVNFGPQWGVWIRHNNQTWTKLHDAAPRSIAAGDVDGDGIEEIVADFDQYGIWLHDPGTGAWRQIHAASCDGMVCANLDLQGGDEVHIDFGEPYGVWTWHYDGAWTQFHTASPVSMCVGQLDGNPARDVVVNFAQPWGLWAFYNGTTWAQLNPVTCKQVVVGDADGDGRDEVVASFGDPWGVTIYSTAAQAWTQLNTVTPDELACADLDGNGLADVIVDFGALYGVCAKDGSSPWRRLHDLTPDAPAAVGGAGAPAASLAAALVSTAVSGSRQPGSISGRLWHDQNGDGACDPGEPRLSGWTVYLDGNNNAVCDPWERTAVTVADGVYAFTGLAGGAIYLVRELAGAGWHATSPANGTRMVALGPGQESSGNDFANRPAASIVGQVWEDRNRNGTPDSGEPRRAGWAVYLDANDNDCFDSGEPLAISSADGSYRFDGLDGGVTYKVREVVPAGWEETCPDSDGHTVSPDPGQVMSGIDFGNRLAVPGVRGTTGVDQIRLVGSATTPGTSEVSVNSAAPTQIVVPAAVDAIRVDGLQGNDTLIVDWRNGNPLPSGGLVYDGGAGDVLRVVDHSGSGVTLTGTQVIVGSGTPISLNNVEGTSFDLGAGRLIKSGDGVAVLVGSSNYTGGTEVIAGTLQVAGANALPVGGSLVIGPRATVVLAPGLSQASALAEAVAASVGNVTRAAGPPVVAGALATGSLVQTEAPSSMTTGATPSNCGLPAMSGPSLAVARVALQAFTRRNTAGDLAGLWLADQCDPSKTAKRKASIRSVVDEAIATLWQ